MAADTTAGDPRPFDPKMVEYLVSLMAQHDLSEIDLHEDGHRIRLRRGGLPVATVPAPVAATPAPAAVPVASAPAATPAAAKTYHEIKSPMVGTFYSKPGPDKPDYVVSGTVVRPDMVVCKLEAMKIFNDLTAECGGTIVEVCVKNGQPVDYGAVLFRVDPS